MKGAPLGKGAETAGFVSNFMVYGTVEAGAVSVRTGMIFYRAARRLYDSLQPAVPGPSVSEIVPDRLQALSDQLLGQTTTLQGGAENLGVNISNKARRRERGSIVGHDRFGITPNPPDRRTDYEFRDIVDELAGPPPTDAQTAAEQAERIAAIVASQSMVVELGDPPTVLDSHARLEQRVLK